MNSIGQQLFDGIQNAATILADFLIVAFVIGFMLILFYILFRETTAARASSQNSAHRSPRIYSPKPTPRPFVVDRDYMRRPPRSGER